MDTKSDEELYNSQMMRLLLDSLSAIPLFAPLTNEELKQLAKYMFFLDFKEGDVVFREGDKGSYVCFVADGGLKVSKRNKSGEETVITTLRKGHSIGEMAVIDDFPRSATVRAAEPSKLITLTRKNFESFVENHPATGNKILKGIARLLSIHLRKTSIQLADCMLPVM